MKKWKGTLYSIFILESVCLSQMKSEEYRTPAEIRKWKIILKLVRKSHNGKQIFHAQIQKFEGHFVAHCKVLWGLRFVDGNLEITVE